MKFSIFLLSCILCVPVFAGETLKLQADMVFALCEYNEDGSNRCRFPGRAGQNINLELKQIDPKYDDVEGEAQVSTIVE